MKFFAQPQLITSASVGLGNVTNTADADKPVSTAQQSALDLKRNDTETISVKTASYTILISDHYTLFTNTGATATVVLTLPTSTGATAGKTRYAFFVNAAFSFRVGVQGTDELRGYQSHTATAIVKTSAAAALAASAVGSYFEVLYIGGGVWIMRGTTGTWA